MLKVVRLFWESPNSNKFCTAPLFKDGLGKNAIFEQITNNWHMQFQRRYWPLDGIYTAVSAHMEVAGLKLHDNLLLKYLNSCLDLFSSWPSHSAYLHPQSVQAELRTQLKKPVRKHPLCEKREETKPMTHRLQYITERASIAASATNPHWHMQPLTVVHGESGPPVWMQRITMAWHSLWINCASWHAQLTVSNSACDLCTAASNILLEQGHKSTALVDAVCYHPHSLL